MYTGIQIFIVYGRAGPPEVVQEVLVDLKSMLSNWKNLNVHKKMKTEPKLSLGTQKMKSEPKLSLGTGKNIVNIRDHWCWNTEKSQEMAFKQSPSVSNNPIIPTSYLIFAKYGMFAATSVPCFLLLKKTRQR